jgi:hypothetical protein
VACGFISLSYLYDRILAQFFPQLPAVFPALFPIRMPVRTLILEAGGGIHPDRLAIRQSAGDEEPEHSQDYHNKRKNLACGKT